MLLLLLILLRQEALLLLVQVVANSTGSARNLAGDGVVVLGLLLVGFLRGGMAGLLCLVLGHAKSVLDLASEVLGGIGDGTLGAGRSARDVVEGDKPYGDPFVVGRHGE